MRLLSRFVLAVALTIVCAAAPAWADAPATIARSFASFLKLNNIWTGTQNFAGAFEIGGVLESFPGSGALVGLGDTQSLTNKTLDCALNTCLDLPSGAVLMTQTGSGAHPWPLSTAYSGKVFTPEQFESPVVQAAPPITDTLTISAGSQLLHTGSAHPSFAVGDRLIIPGLGASASIVTPNATGTGTASGVQAVTVLGGSCGTAITVNVAFPSGLPQGFPANGWGNCPGQPGTTNVATSTALWSGYTLNIQYVPLEAIILSVTDNQDFVLSVAASAGLSAVSTEFAEVPTVAETSTAAANAVAAANAAAAADGAATLQLSGANYWAAAGINITPNAHLTIDLGGGTVYPIGTAAGGFFAAGAGAGTPTTLTASANKGAQCVSVTSNAAFKIGAYFTVQANNAYGVQLGQTNRVQSLPSGQVCGEDALGFDANSGAPNAVTPYIFAEHLTIRNGTINCKFSAGAGSGFNLGSLAHPDIENVEFDNCLTDRNTLGNIGFGAFFGPEYHGYYHNLVAKNSANNDLSFSIEFFLASPIWADATVENGQGFAIGWEQSGGDHHFKVTNNPNGRGDKHLGAWGGGGYEEVSNVPAPWVCIFLDGSDYDNLAQADVAGCNDGFETDGLGSLHTTLGQLNVSTTTVPLDLGANDTYTTVKGIDYQTGAAASGNFLAASHYALPPGRVPPTAAAGGFAYTDGDQFLTATPFAGLALGNTSGQPTAYAGTSCSNQVITALSASGVATCAPITNAYLSAGTFSNITGTGTLTAGATGAGFTINFAASSMNGQVPLTYGGTGSNLSGTGGASQVLKQTSSGGAVTVGQLALSDLSALTYANDNFAVLSATATASAVAGQLSIGTTTPSGTPIVTINGNVTQTPPTPYAGTSLELVGKDANIASVAGFSYGNWGMLLNANAAGGTLAAPSNVSATNLFAIQACGYNSGFAIGGEYQITASQAWGAGAQGTQHNWLTTANSTASLTTSMRLQASGGLSVGSGNVATDDGNGSIVGTYLIPTTSVAGGIAAGSTLLLNSTTNGTPTAGGTVEVVTGTYSGTPIVAAAVGLVFQASPVSGNAYVGSYSTGGVTTLHLQANNGGALIDGMVIGSTGGITTPALPTSAGSGGLYDCVDSTGIHYKKSACP